MIRDFETVACPICGSNKCHKVREKHDIVECDKCGIVYLRTRGTAKALEQHYQTYASNPGSHMRVPSSLKEAESNGLKRDYFLNELMEFTRTANDRKLLDLGSGWGAFLLNARSRGFNVNGCEICKEMADYATNVLKIYTHQSQFEQCALAPRSLRAITMLHSLEHLPNTRTALAYAHALLSDGGWLAGIVPNYASFMSQAQGDKWCWLDPDMHYLQFTMTTLRNTLRSFGFDVARMYTVTDDFDRNLIEQTRRQKNEVRSIEQLEAAGRGEAIRFFAQRE